MNTKHIKIYALAAITAAVALSGVHAEIITVKTSKGSRLAVVGNPPSAAQVQSGIHGSCPVMKKERVQREYALDGKGHKTAERAGLETSMPGGRFVVQRDGASSTESSTVMKHLK